MKEKIIVKIPLDLDDLEKGYKEVKFKTVKEVAEFLNTTTQTIKAILSGKIVGVYEPTRHLQDIKIEYIDNKPVIKTQEERKEYIKKLLEKSA